MVRVKKLLIGLLVLFFVFSSITFAKENNNRLKVFSNGISHVVDFKIVEDGKGDDVQEITEGTSVAGNVHLTYANISGVLNDKHSNIRYHFEGENIFKSEDDSLLTFQGMVTNYEDLMFQAEAIKGDSEYEVYFNIIKIQDNDSELNEGEVINSFSLNGKNPHKRIEPIHPAFSTMTNYYEFLGEKYGYYFDIRHEGNKDIGYQDGAGYYQARMTTNSDNVNNYWYNELGVWGNTTVREYDTLWYTGDNGTAYEAARPSQNEETNFSIPFWAPIIGTQWIPVSIDTASVHNYNGDPQMGVTLHWQAQDNLSYKDDNHFDESPEEGDGFAIRVNQAVNYSSPRTQTYYIDHDVLFRTSFTPPGMVDKYLRVIDTTSYDVNLIE